MNPRPSIVGVCVCVLLLAGGAAHASTITFSGQDNGLSNTGPFPNSAAVQSSFISAALLLGTTNTLTFEAQPTGYYTPFSPATGVSIALTGPNACAPGLCGISHIAGLFGIQGFNTTSGGSGWLGFPGGTATFSFATPTNSFGAFFTGLQTIYTSPGQLMITFNDGSPQTLLLPVNVNGGAQYFGFTSTVALSSITIANLGPDAWGIDDVTYNTSAPTTAPVPEPASLMLLGTGLLRLAAARRRRPRS